MKAAFLSAFVGLVGAALGRGGWREEREPLEAAFLSAFVGLVGAAVGRGWSKEGKGGGEGRLWLLLNSKRC